MGEIAEGILDGAFCQECGEYIGEDACYPRSCASCSDEEEDEEENDETT